MGSLLIILLRISSPGWIGPMDPPLGITGPTDWNSLTDDLRDPAVYFQHF